MEYTDKRDVLLEVQRYIKDNSNSGDVDALVLAIEKALQDNYILDCDAIEVLDFVDRYKGGICVSEPYKGYEPKYECELDIWTKGGKCYALVRDAVHRLKKKYACKMQPQQGGVMSSCDAVFKRDVMQPQHKRTRRFADCVLVEDKEECVARLHELIDNKVGKAVAMVIKAAIETGLILKPTSTQVKEEFKDIGCVRGYNKYMEVDYTNEPDYLNIKNILWQHKK